MDRLIDKEKPQIGWSVDLLSHQRLVGSALNMELYKSCQPYADAWLKANRNRVVDVECRDHLVIGFMECDAHQDNFFVSILKHIKRFLRQ